MEEIEVIGPQKYYLLKYDYNWADEADFRGFQLVDQKGLDAINKGIDEAYYPREHYFGTNEEIIFEDASEVREGIEVIEITHIDYETLKNLFGMGFGSTPDFVSWESEEV